MSPDPIFGDGGFHSQTIQGLSLSSTPILPFLTGNLLAHSQHESNQWLDSSLNFHSVFAGQV